MITRQSDQGLLVLLVADDEDDYVLVRDLLDQVDTALYRLRWESGVEGAVRAIAEERPGVVLADYAVGDGRGLELLRELGSGGEAPPVILLTAEGDRESDLLAMEAGAADYLVKRTLDGNLLERSIRYSVRQHRLLSEIHSLLLTDELTGLHNRRGFFALAAQQLALAQRRSLPCVLFYGDLDNLKEINDVRGHAAGDRAIHGVATVLRRTFRASDLLARIGGDEFAVLAVEADESSVEGMLQRLEAGLDVVRDAPERALGLSISIGWTVFRPHDPEPLEALLAEADRAMYQQKRRRKAASEWAAGERERRDGSE